MKANEFMNSLSRGVHKLGFEIQKKSPEILVGVGIVTAIAGAVLACKATTKAGKVIDEAKNSVQVIEDAKKNGKTNAGEDYTDEDRTKDLAITYIQTGAKLLKLYAPALISGGVAITCILASHNIMKKRNLALAAAYSAVDGSFKEYKKRVAEKFGEEAEKELRLGTKAKEIEESSTDENGEEKQEKKVVDVVPDGFDPLKYSPYAKIFDESNPMWHKDADYNLFFLRANQGHANDKLQARGHLFLNEVYDMLGFPRTKAGAVMGWIYDPKRPIGDNFVDFGIYDVRREKNRDFVNGYERSIILDFNVTNILDHIEDHQHL